jgi:ribose 1,5-bisphosphokinase PhnN
MNRYDASDRPRSLVVVGASGSGKTTLVNGLRAPEHARSILTPLRVVTRPERREDQSAENHFVDQHLFRRLMEAGRLAPCWSRTLEHGRVERYGFESVDAADPRLRVYSANNALLRDPSPQVRTFLRKAVVVVVVAHGACRRTRMEQKDMSRHEREIRLSDDGRDIVSRGASVRVIDTTDLPPAEGQAQLRSIAEDLLAARSAVSIERSGKRRPAHGRRLAVDPIPSST